jgi:hypothetical protein
VLVLSRVLFAQNSTFATSLEVVTLHGTVPERVWPAVTLLERSCGAVAVVVGAVVVVVVVVGVVVVVVVGVVVVVVVVVVGVDVDVDVVVFGPHALACDCGLQSAAFLPEARAAPPVKRARTAIATKPLRIAERDVKEVFFMAAGDVIGPNHPPSDPSFKGRRLPSLRYWGYRPRLVQRAKTLRCACTTAMIRAQTRIRYRSEGGMRGLGVARLVACVAIGASLVGAFSEQARSRIGVGRPTLRVTPSAIEFGASVLGATKSRTVTIMNTSDGPLTLSAGWAADSTLDPGFGFPTGDSCLQQEVEVLQPSQSCTLTFTFTPVAAGVAEATFAFSIDGWQSIEARVRLKGRAVA